MDRASSAAPRPTRGRRWARALLALSAPVLLLALFILEENVRGRWMLWRVRDALRERGERWTLAELGYPRPAPAGSGAPAAIAAARELKALAENNRLVSFGPRGLMKSADPGRAYCACREARFPSGNGYREADRQGRAAADDWVLAAAELASARGPLDKLRAALAQPVLTVEQAYTSDPVPPRGEWDLWASHTWLTSDAVCALHAGDLDAAVDDICALRGLVRLERTDLRLVSQETACNNDLFASALVWEALQLGGWTEDRLRRLQDAMHDDEEYGSALRACELQRAVLPAAFAGARDSEAERQMAFRLENRDVVADLTGDNPVPSPSEFGVLLHSTLWRAAWSHQDEARALNLWSGFLAQVRPLAADRSWMAFAARYPKRRAQAGGLGNWRWSFSEMINPRSGRYQLASIARSSAEHQMALAHIAVKRWELRKKDPPPSLAALTPDILPQPPIDMMDGKPLRYRLSQNGFVLYSVGLDGGDDGGDPTTTTGEDKVRSLWAGRDAVWPQAIPARAGR